MKASLNDAGLSTRKSLARSRAFMVPSFINERHNTLKLPTIGNSITYIHSMSGWKRILSLIVVAAISLTAFAQTDSLPPAGKAIDERIGKLRSLSDTDRVGATKSLAMDIRNLPSGEEKRLLAASLAFISTEGDFGRDTLQAVTDTLVQSVKETPPAREKEKAPSTKDHPAFEYKEIAQLAKYEHMKVDLDNADYKEAYKDLVALDEKRNSADFTLTDLSGKSWTLSQLKGKVVVVNFWATWCPPCRKEMPDLETIFNKYKDQGLVILGISDETNDKVQPFIAEHKYSYPILLDPGRKVNDLFVVDGIPKNFVYNREGKLVAESIDMRTMGQFMEMLKAAGIQ